jgi:hypothetical protein
MKKEKKFKPKPGQLVNLDIIVIDNKLPWWKNIF